MQAPQHRPSSSATFHPAEKPGQRDESAEVFDDQEPSPEDEDEMAQPQNQGLADLPNIDMAEGDLGSDNTDNNVDRQMPPESQKV